MTAGCRFSLRGAVPVNAAVNGEPTNLVVAMFTGGTQNLELSAYVLRTPLFLRQSLCNLWRRAGRKSSLPTSMFCGAPFLKWRTRVPASPRAGDEAGSRGS